MAVVRLPRDPSCSGVARRIFENSLDCEVDDGEFADVMLIASELVNNAFAHGEGRIELRVEMDDRLRIEVADEHPECIEITPSTDHSPGGSGLRLVEQLSLAWGATTHPTRVWAEVRCQPLGRG